MGRSEAACAARIKKPPGGAGGPDMSKLEGGLNELPSGIDPSKLNFGGKKKK